MKNNILSNTKTGLTLIFLASTLFFTSCEKEGATGPAGQPGLSGKDGQNGKDGVANIKTSTYTTTNSDWSFDSQLNSYDATINAPSITQDVAENGTIQMFIKTQNSYVALPFIINAAQFNYGYKVGEVSVIASLVDGSIPNNPGGMTFKVVVIPPANLKSEVDYTNYETLQRVYGFE